jgi:hypothetical protein
VYDVEAEGGLVGGGQRSTPVPRPTEEPLDLMMAMRERAAHRGRQRRRKSPATQTPLDHSPREDALPLEDIAYDPESMPPPPPARGAHAADSKQPDDAVDERGADVLPAAQGDRRQTRDADERPAGKPEERPRPAKRNGRPSVPSWDDVMFGARPRD